MKIIKLAEIRGEDPILRKGDLVKLLKSWKGNKTDLAKQCKGHCGFVTEVTQRFGEDSPAPSQARKISIAFPFEDGWYEIFDVPIFAIHRILNKDLAMRDEAYENA
tara:strand:- start:83 stop:400 length:318 start_codon:yes stop_codon:yes gene_type:complete